MAGSSQMSVVLPSDFFGREGERKDDGRGAGALLESLESVFTPREAVTPKAAIPSLANLPAVSAVGTRPEWNRSPRSKQRPDDCRHPPGSKRGDVAFFCAEVDRMLEKRNDQILTRLEEWMTHQDKVIYGMISPAGRADPKLQDGGKISDGLLPGSHHRGTEITLTREPRPKGTKREADTGAPNDQKAVDGFRDSLESSVRGGSFEWPGSEEKTLQRAGTKNRPALVNARSRKISVRATLVESAKKIDTYFSWVDTVDNIRSNRTKGFASAYLAAIEEPAKPPEASPRCSRTFEGIVKSHPFELFFTLVIITNTLFVGFQTQYAALHRGDTTSLEFLGIECVYTLIFTAELVLRILAYGRRFVCSDAWHWNLLDLMIVLTSLLEVVIEVHHRVNDEQDKGTSGMRVLKTIRFTRLVRALRIVRIMRFVSALRVLVYTIIRTLKSLGWSLVLLIILFYLFGILFTQAATDYLVDNGHFGQPTPAGEDSCASDISVIKKYYGDLVTTMFTLFKSITGGISWDVVVHPLSAMGWLWVVVFTGYIAFTSFAVLNVMTSVFCQSAIESSQNDREALVQHQLKHKQVYLNMVRKLFHELDLDESGVISMEEFSRNLEREDMKAYLDSLELSTSDALTLFQLLDVDGTLTIDIEEFMMGCLRLRGNAKSMDLAKVMMENKTMINRLARMSEVLASMESKQAAMMLNLRVLAARTDPCHHEMEI